MKKRPYTVQTLCVHITFLVVVSVMLPLLTTTPIPIYEIFSGALGLLVQAVPFLLIGVLVSSAIETFISVERLHQYAPKSLLGGLISAVFAGFCIPVCDCATVPVFARLLNKGLTLPVAVTFFVATPIVNPIVFWSTWYAFPQQPWMAVARLVVGVLIAIIVGALCSFIPQRYTQHLLRSIINASNESCQCSDCDSQMSSSSRTITYITNVRNDFYRIMPMMMLGIVIASTVRIVVSGIHVDTSTLTGSLLSLFALMLLAFISCLCSTSDAVIASGFLGIFPLPAILGYLVFGPVLDLKNVFMMTAMLDKRLVGMVVTSFTIIVSIVMSIITVMVTLWPIV